MTMNRHEEWDELVSASLTGDLTNEERARLDAHLPGCAECRATLAMFSDQRQIVAGLRHLPVPADLGARVRTGIEGGSRVGLPWWRRPATLFAGVGGGLALVAGVLLAIVLLNGSPDPQIGEDASPTPSGSPPAATDATPMPSAPAPSASPVESAPVPSVAPTPAPTPISASPEPDVYLALTGPFDNQMLTLRDGTTGESITELGTSAVPIAAELSPDGQWLAYITQLGESGLNEIRVTRVGEVTDSPIEVGETVVIGESVAGSPFLEQLPWSPDSRYLAYTLADPSDNGTDVWLFTVANGLHERITDVGNAYAGSWFADGVDTAFLWVSTAGEVPMSHLMSWQHGETDIVAVVPPDPADNPYPAMEGVFQPLVSPNGSLAIYWKGRMVQSGAEWLFAEGAAPYLAEHREAEMGFEFVNEREIFTDVTIGRDAFTSAAITWGLDSDSFAIWAVQWAGISQGASGQLYPDEEDVYFGYATDPRHITRTHAIDEADIPEGWRVVDVKVPATGQHLVITSAAPRAGVQDPPRANLAIITRNTGSVADFIDPLGDGAEGWIGPAAFDAHDEPVTP